MRVMSQFTLIVYLLNLSQVMEQFFGLVNTFLRNHRDTWKRRLGVRTYKVSSPFKYNRRDC